VQAIGHVDHGHRSAEVALAVIEFHAHFMQGAHIFPDNWLCTPFVSNSDHRSLKNRILVTGKKYFLMTEKFLPSSYAESSDTAVGFSTCLA